MLYKVFLMYFVLFLVDHFEFKVHQDAHIGIRFYFIFLKTVGWKRIVVIRRVFFCLCGIIKLNIVNLYQLIDPVV